jgi:hypothetical protein
MNFNWEIYREINPDLIRAGLNTKQQIETHYKTYGIREKRKISVNQICPGFNPSVYRNNYSDLKNLNDTQVCLHWLRNGRKEGRSYITKNAIIVNKTPTVQNQILFIIGNNISNIFNNYDYMNIIKNNISIKFNLIPIESLKMYKKVVLLGCPENNSRVTDIIKFCDKNKIVLFDTNTTDVRNIFKNILNMYINRSINHWKTNKCISTYFSDSSKLHILKTHNVPLHITPNNNLHKKIQDTSVINKFDGKFISFILILKNRQQRFEMFINYLKNVKKFNNYCELIIVEDNSNNTVDLSILGDINYKYYLVHTGIGWSRTKLINYGLSKTTLHLSLFCDIDFVFEPNFVLNFTKNFNKFNFDRLGLCIPVFETHTSFNNNEVVRRANAGYGHVLIVSTNRIKNLGGFDFNINNHGFEERELWLRCLARSYEFCFINDLYNDMYVLHVSHDEVSRGAKNNSNDQKNIVNKLKHNINIPFVYMLPTIQTVE